MLCALGISGTTTASDPRKPLKQQEFTQTRMSSYQQNYHAPSPKQPTGSEKKGLINGASSSYANYGLQNILFSRADTTAKK